MNYLIYANYIGSGTEFLAVAAALIFKSYRTKFGLIIFLMPLSSCIADSLVLHFHVPRYIPTGMIYGIFDLFNTFAFFKIIDVFSKIELKVILLIKIIFAAVLVSTSIEILKTKFCYEDIASGISHLFNGFLGILAAYRLIQLTAKEKKGFSHFFHANLSVTIFNLLLFSPLIGEHLLQKSLVEFNFWKIIVIWIPIGNIIRNLMLTHLFYLRRNVTA